MEYPPHRIANHPVGQLTEVEVERGATSNDYTITSRVDPAVNQQHLHILKHDPDANNASSGADIKTVVVACLDTLEEIIPLSGSDPDLMKAHAKIEEALFHLNNRIDKL